MQDRQLSSSTAESTASMKGHGELCGGRHTLYLLLLGHKAYQLLHTHNTARLLEQNTWHYMGTTVMQGMF